MNEPGLWIGGWLFELHYLLLQHSKNTQWVDKFLDAIDELQQLKKEARV